MAAAMSLFMAGSVFMYYGDEIGMPGSGNDPSKRAPMVWSTEGAEGTTTLPPGCTLPGDGYPLGGLEQQKADESSLYNYYRELIAVRNAIPTIARGVPTVETGLNIGCVSASRRTWGEEECIILMNIDDEAAVADLSGYTDWEVKVTLSADGQPTELEGTDLNMAPYGVAILTPKK
jgi:glycosidase